MDALIAIPLILALAYPFFRRKMWRWIGLIAIVCVYEAFLALVTGKSLSQEFWANFSWGLIFLLLGAWVLLLVHLSWKQIKKRREKMERERDSWN